MIQIKQEEDLLLLQRDNIESVNFRSLLRCHSLTQSQRALACILLYMQAKRERGGAHYTLKWIIHNLGSPFHYERGSADEYSLCYRAGELVYILHLVAGLFVSFSATPYQCFVRDEVDESSFCKWPQDEMT